MATGTKPRKSPPRSTARTPTTPAAEGTTPRRKASSPSARSRASSRAVAAPRASRWYGRIDPARVAFLLVLVALAALLGLLLDVYLGQDAVHVLMVHAFGPLAFLVPLGAGFLAIDFYRRFEGKRTWLRFEESCGAVLLFVAALTLGGLAGWTFSLVGNSLGDEMATFAGRPGAVLATLVLLVIGAVLAFHITAAHVGQASRLVARAYGAGAREAGSMARRWRAGRAARRAQADAAASPAQTPDALAAGTQTATFTARSRRGKNAPAPTTTAPTVKMPPLAPLDMTQDGGGPSSPLAPDFAADGDGDSDMPAPPPIATSWPAPGIDVLDAVPAVTAAAPANHDARARVIEETLASFNVEADVVDVQSGPTVTQFGLRPAAGVRVQRITALQNDLALALAAPSIRIEAPVPGKPFVGIEIPNGTTALVTLREILESDACKRLRSPLKVALGKNVAGDPVAVDLARMPHLLIAGATGSGKSACLNSLICCLLFHNSPEQLRLLMIDPKMVELTTFNGVPHLLHPVVTDMEKVSGTLKWVLKEMHRRYKLFGEAGARNIARYNEMQAEKLARGEPAIEKNRPLPYIVFIIDELADLMMVSPAEVEDSISRLAALARATGIHLVLATQRPSVDVITGVIKANFPARIAFAVSSQVDSRTIIDQGGAEKLLGRGDMLYLPSDGSKPMRAQGAFVSDQEVERLVQFWSNSAPDRPETPQQIAPSELEAPKDGDGGDNKDEDKLLADATKVVREYRRASVSLLQRRLAIGYSRAARLLDQLEEHGVVGPSEDGRSRIVLDTGDDAADPDASPPPDEA